MKTEDNYSQTLALSAISSSLSAANHKHFPSTSGSILKLYFELASRRRSRFLTIVAAV